MQTQSSYGGSPPWTRPGFLLAAAGAIVVLVIAAIVVFSGGRSTPDTNGATGPSAPATASADLAAGSQEIPTTAPQGVTWTALGQRILPYSATAGPATMTATTATGFAHSPTGALVAAAQISSRSGLSAGKAIYEPAVLNQMVASADRDTLLSGLQAAAQEPAGSGELATYAGFRFVTYTQDTAVLELVMKSPGTQVRYQMTQCTMRWVDGDWKLQAPPGGSWLSVTHVASDLSGVVEWGPQ